MAFGSRFRPPDNGAFFKQIGFGVFIILFSLLFVWKGLSHAWKQEQHRQRIEVPCTIEQFEITTNPNREFAFQPDLTFHYQWQGADLVGTKLWPEKEGAHQYQELTDIRRELLSPSGKATLTTCFVNPEHPQDASLIAQDPGKNYGGWFFAGFGGVFTLIGSLMVIGAIRQKQRGEDCSSLDDMIAKPIAVIGCGFFGIVGFGLLFGLTLPIVFDLFAFQGWEKASGTVEWSRVRNNDSHKIRDRSYTADIFYRYAYRGETHYSNNYSCTPIGINRYAPNKEVVQQYPSGTDLVCYVNPDKPWQATVTRKFGWDGLVLLFPLPFLWVFSIFCRSFYREWKKSRLPAGEGRRKTHRKHRLRERWRK